MSEFRFSPEAEAELDGIWIHIARVSGSIDIATRVVESVSERFWQLLVVRVVRVSRGVPALVGR